MIKYKNFFYGLILIALAFQTIKFYSFYLEYSDWQYADWLINYQGGFIRRGMVGEILFQIHNIFKIKLDLLVLILICLLYFLLTLFLIKSIKYLSNSKLDTLIFLSPGFFLYPIMNSEIIGRKELLLFVVIGTFVFLEKNFRGKYLLIALVSSIFLVSLTHTGLLFYTPYLIFIYFLIKIVRKEKSYLNELIIILLTILVTLSLIYFNQGSKTQVFEICNSIKNFILEDCPSRAQFGWLATPVQEHLNVKIDSGLVNYIFFYLISLIFVFIFISIKLYNSYFNTYNIILNKLNPFYVLLFLFLLTIPIYILGYDWGRYISMSYFCSFFIYIYCIKKRLLKINFNKFCLNFNTSKKFFILFTIIYTLAWTFPFYGGNNIKLPLKKPIIQLQKILDKNDF